MKLTTIKEYISPLIIGGVSFVFYIFMKFQQDIVEEQFIFLGMNIHTYLIIMPYAIILGTIAGCYSTYLEKRGEKEWINY